MSFFGSLPHARRRLVLVAALAALLLVAGCSGSTESEPELPSGTEAAEQFSTLGAYNATVVFESKNDTITSRSELTVRPATGERYEEVVTGGNRRITVSNGTTTWSYRPADNEVTITSLEGGSGPRNQTSRIRKLFEAVEGEQATESQVVPFFPLLSPTSAAPASSPAAQTGLWSGPVEVRYEGVEAVGDRDAHAFEMESAEGTDKQMHQSLYVDTEHYVVLQREWELELQVAGESERIAGSMRVEDIEFEPTLHDDIFEFEPPENASVTRPGRNIDSFESYDALVAGSDKPVPSPQPPAGFAFDSGSNTTSGVTLVYTNGTADVFVTRRTTGGVREEAEQITRSGRTYFYIDRRDRRTVQWACDGAVYAVGGQVDRETVLGVADTVQCLPTAG